MADHALDGSRVAALCGHDGADEGAVGAFDVFAEEGGDVEVFAGEFVEELDANARLIGCQQTMRTA